jgi:pentose-5-phosphate-3-epimerase
MFPSIKRQVIEAGANAIVAGSAVFCAPDYAEGMPSSQWHPSLIVYCS